MRAWMAVLCLLLAGPAPAAQNVYAVMSLVGDGLLVVRHRPVTGTSLPDTVHEFLPVKDPIFDRTALLAVDEAVGKAEPGAKTVLLGADASLVEAQSRALADDDPARSIAAAVRARLPATGATRLILVVKSRHPAWIEFGESHVGSGMLEGLGYYIDDAVLPLDRQTTGDTDVGLLAPFAYFTVALVDLASGKVVAEKSVHAARSVSEKFSQTLSPWDALTAEQKVSFVRDLLRRELAGAVPALLAVR
ncbi:MAG TPA: hypothetical protein VLY46_01795 [Usitatibacter sp.]|nr:hypothetical protein [Usitatibacter sp.]